MMAKLIECVAALLMLLVALSAGSEYEFNNDLLYTLLLFISLTLLI